MDREKQRQMTADLYNKLTSSIEDNQEHYKKYAQVYDELSLSFGYTLPSEMVKFCLKYLPNPSDQTLLLDVGAGTGLIAKYLREEGFKGVIDGLDGSEAMLTASNFRNQYRNFVIQLIMEGQRLALHDNCYDAVICCGALGDGHIPWNTVKEMMRTLKPGGLLVFELEDDLKSEDNKCIMKIMTEMEHEGKCKLVEKKTVTGVHEEESGISSADLCCYKKLI